MATLQDVLKTKSEINAAITNQGVDMTGVKFPQYPAKIGEIKGAPPRLGVVVADASGAAKFQPLSFTGTTPADSGSPEDFAGYIYNTGKDEPVFPGGGGGGGGEVVTCDYYKCSAVDASKKTWSGNKAIFAEGIYTFESKETTGLKFDTVTPSVGKIYTADALVEVNKLYEGIKETALVWLEPSLSNNEVKDLSNSLTTIESIGVTVNDKGQMLFNAPSFQHLFYDFKLTPNSTDVFKIELDFELTGAPDGYLCAFQGSGGDYPNSTSIRIAYDGTMRFFGGGDWFPTGGIGKHSLILTWDREWSAIYDQKPLKVYPGSLSNGLEGSGGYIGNDGSGALDFCGISKFKLSKIEA